MLKSGVKKDSGQVLKISKNRVNMGLKKILDRF